MWGTNAVNGVINITTRSAGSTLGTLLSLGAGDQEAGASVRHGWRVGANTAMRVYARYFDRDAHRLEIGGSALDEAKRWQAGFRLDRETGASTSSVQGEAYGSDVNNPSGARDLAGGHVIGRWSGAISPGTSATVHAYLDRTDRVHAGSFEEVRDTLDLEAQLTRRSGERHLLSGGAGYRGSRDRTVPTAVLGFVPAERTLHLFSLYAQDEMRLTPGLVAMAGLRAEHNSYTGWEWLPSLRAAYTMAPRQVVWGALSRAVRTPSRIDADLVVPGFPPFRVVNNPGFESEVAKVAEVGYRGGMGNLASVSLSVFHHRYERLRTVEAANGGFTLANGAEGRTSGLEAWGDLRPFEDWRLVWGYTRKRHSTAINPGHANLGDDPLGNNPRSTASLRSQMNIGEKVQLDLFARYVGKLPAPAIPSYTQLSGRIAWRVSRQLELSLTGSNMLDAHVEFGASNVRVVFERSYFAKATWSF